MIFVLTTRNFGWLIVFIKTFLYFRSNNRNQLSSRTFPQSNYPVNLINFLLPIYR